MVRCSLVSMPLASIGRLLVIPPRQLCTRSTARAPHRSVVLPRGASDVQPTARLSCGPAAGPARYDPDLRSGSAIGQKHASRRRSGSRAGGDIAWGDPLAAPPRASCADRDRSRLRSDAGTTCQRWHRPSWLSSRTAPIASDDCFDLRSGAARIWGSQSDRQCARPTRGGA